MLNKKHILELIKTGNKDEITAYAKKAISCTGGKMHNPRYTTLSSLISARGNLEQFKKEFPDFNGTDKQLRKFLEIVNTVDENESFLEKNGLRADTYFISKLFQEYKYRSIIVEFAFKYLDESTNNFENLDSMFDIIDEDKDEIIDYLNSKKDIIIDICNKNKIEIMQKIVPANFSYDNYRFDMMKSVSRKIKEYRKTRNLSSVEVDVASHIFEDLFFYNEIRTKNVKQQYHHLVLKMKDDVIKFEKELKCKALRKPGFYV